ncbi:MAG: AraC family transcriptional regulator ligand-binding domain-containing protein [Deltaproteobacteria bacterium]
MSDPVLPMTYLQRLLQLVERRGCAVDELLAELGLAREVTENANGWIALATFSDALHRAAMRARDPSLGLELGLSLQPTAHSWYGYALMTASTVRDACELGMRFLDVRLDFWRVTLSIEDDTAVMQFEQRCDLGPDRQMLLDAFLGAAMRLAEFLHGHPLAGSAFEFYATYPRPAYYARYADQLPRIHHDCAVMQARHPAAWLDRSVALADGLTNREAVTVLEEELHTIAPDDWVGLTRAMLADPKNEYPDLDAGANKLGVSARTLRRHLQARGTTYRELREHARRDAASKMIATARTSIDTVARKLGYADLAAFSHAFQRWTGESPSDYRRRHRP